MSIGTTIKKLRREHNITQEQLAEYLGITANSVSQWECDRTAPDISQLPVLANIFDVSTDYILDVDTSKKNEMINNIRQQAWELCNSGDKAGAIKFIRRGLDKFPNNYKMMSDLTVFLYQQAFHQKCTSQEHYSLCTDAAKFLDKIIAGCNDIIIKSEAIQLACSIFPAIGRYNDALKLTDMIPDISKDDLLTTLYSDDKLTEHIKNVICKSVALAADQIVWLASRSKTDGSHLYNDDEKLLLYEKAVSLYYTLYENGDFYFDAETLAEAEKHIADIRLKKNDIERSLYYLEKCVDHIVMFDTYDEYKNKHTSLIPYGKVPVGINRNNSDNSSHSMLNRFKNHKEYKLIINHPKYRNLIKRLEQADNKNEQKR